jgi:hypothetical protein
MELRNGLVCNRQASRHSQPAAATWEAAFTLCWACTAGRILRARRSGIVSERSAHRRGHPSDSGGEAADERVALGRVGTGVSKYQSVEFSPRCARQLREVASNILQKQRTVTLLVSLHRNPSPERFDEALCGESPLEKSIADPAQ